MAASCAPLPGTLSDTVVKDAIADAQRGAPMLQAAPKRGAQLFLSAWKSP